MTAAALSRRGFLARAAAGVVGLVGGSVVGGLSTRAWAHPLQRLRSGERPVIDQPRSVVPIGLDEAMRRERRALELPEVGTLMGALVSSGYERAGRPVGVDGVPGWPTEGGRAVSLGFARSETEEATVFVVARWWDEKRREPWPCEDVMPDVFAREVLHGTHGRPTRVRFRYVDERGGIATREETLDASSIDCSDLNCHPHPPGPCPPSCDGAGPNLCVHCYYWENVCSDPPPDCSACAYCALCVHYACGVSCSLVCAGICNGLAEKYCCDFNEFTCCPFNWTSPLPPQINCL